MKANNKKKQVKSKEITVYDNYETGNYINENSPITFEDLGIALPSAPKTQVVSLRLPTYLLNQLKAIGSQQDIPYQALIKLYLNQMVAKEKRRCA